MQSLRPRRLALGAPVALVAALACASPESDEPEEGGGTATTQDAGESETGAEHSPIPEVCLVGASPQSIPELVAHIDGLPHPVTIPCVLASLSRPLRVVASESTFSIQPAVGEDSPRIFVLGEGLILSVVPAGEGAHLLEFSEWINETHTIKGELEFPVAGPLDEQAPYDYTFFDQLTGCGVCHRDESELRSRPGAFASEAIRPTVPSLVSLATLHAARESCDWTAEPERCAMLSGLLDFGAVEQGAFPDELPTIFDDP